MADTTTVTATATIALTEKVVIFGALLAGLPLTHLDSDMLGFRRYVWLGASILGLISLCLLDPTSSIASTVDSISFALLSTALVPHLIQLINDQSWLGIGVLPPFFMATYQSTRTVVDKNSAEYWQVRCFLHLFAFTLPYLNHLPSSPVATGTGPPTSEDGNDDGEPKVENEQSKTSTKPKSGKKSNLTNKKKR
jgi:hypothetical protein